MASPLRAPFRARLHLKPHRLFAALTVACSLSAGAAAELPLTGAAATQVTGAASASLSTTLAKAWERALAANPGLQAAKFGAAATEGGILQARARPNPELAFSQEDTRSSTRTSTVQLNQLVELGGKREARVRLAESEEAAANATVIETQAALRHQLVSYFHELLLAQQRIQLASKNHELATQALDAAQKRVQAGKVPPLDASRAKVAQATAALELEQAKSSIVVAQQNLATLWGGRASEVGEASGDFSATADAPAADELETLVEASPAMVLARHTLDQSRAASELERAKRVQDLTISVGVKRAQEVGRNQVVLGASIPLPLFDRNAGNQLQALRKVDQAEKKLQEQRLLIQSQVFAARQKLLSSNQQVALLNSQVIPTAQSAYDVAVRGFTLGKFNFLEVLDAQRTLFDSQRQLLDQLMASHSARAEIDRALGTSAPAHAYNGI